MARILSIEDDGEFQQLLGLVLGREGYEVHYAFSGQEGYEKALSLSPDLILLDMKLPMLSGPEVIERLKAQPETRETPIVVMTAHYKSIEFLEKKIKPMGIVEYLRKPIQMDELRSLVRRVLAAKPPASAPRTDAVRRGDLRLEPDTRTVWIEDKLAVILAPKRFAVLAELMRTGGPVSRETLLTKIWKGGGSVNTLEKTVERLRKDLGPEGPRRILTTEEGYELI